MSSLCQHANFQEWLVNRLKVSSSDAAITGVNVPDHYQVFILQPWQELARQFGDPAILTEKQPSIRVTTNH